MFLLTAALYAEENYRLDPTTITATRSTAPIEEQPLSIHRHTREDLDSGIGRTALDRINYGAGVLIQRTAPSQASPFIRGLTGEQSLLLFDGVRLSHAMMRPGPNQYAAMLPENSLSSVDVILGSSSVVQGSDGLTGALDFRLAPAGGMTETMSPWLKAKADHANGSKIAVGVDSGVGDRNWLFSIDGSLEDYHNRIGGKDAGDRLFNYSGGKNEIPNTAYDQWSLGVRLAYLGASDHSYEMNLGKVSQNDAPRPDGYPENSFNASNVYRYYEEQVFTYLHLRDRWDLNQNWAQTMTTTLAWHRHEESQRRLNSSGSRYREFDDEIDSTSLDMEFQSGFGAHALTWGATVTDESTSNTASDNTKLVATTSVPDGSKYRSLGVYAQNDQDLGRGWNLLYGLRYSRSDWEYLKNGVMQDSNASDLTWNLRGQYFLSEGTRVFAGVSRAFRSPNLKNLSGFVDRASSGAFVSGNSDLDPETSITTEIGYNLVNENGELGVTLFDTRIDDLIARDVDATSGNVENVDSAHLYGFEVESSLTLYDAGDSSWNIGVFTTASYVRATMKIELPGGGTLEDNISRANRFYGRTGFSFEHSEGIKGLLQARWHDTYDKVSTWQGDSDSGDRRLTVPGDVTGAMPGYAVFDLRLDWVNESGRQEWGIGVENIFNKTYREPGSGADGSGRNLFLEASLRY